MIIRSSAGSLAAHLGFSARSWCSMFSTVASSSSFTVPYINRLGRISYLSDGEKFPYYTPPPLPQGPVDIRNYRFNSLPLDAKKNSIGKVTEGSNHNVYRGLDPLSIYTYLKDLSHSKVGGKRSEADAQFLAYQESFANWLMYHLFGPKLIPFVYPVKFGNSWGIASTELQYYGTMNQLAERVGYSQKEIEYGASAMQVINGQTFLLRGKGEEPLRVMGRIALKVALRMLTAHYDIESHSKNCFMALVDDPTYSRQVVCPGIFDLGCVFSPELMREFIQAWEDASLKGELVDFLARNAVDAHIKELNVDDFEKISGRFFTKRSAFDRIANMPWDKIREGLQWFKEGSPKEAHAHIDLIGKYLSCVKEISMAVVNKIALMILEEKPFEEYLAALPSKRP